MAKRSVVDAEIVIHPEYATVERTISEQNTYLIERYGAHHIGVSKKFRKGRKLPDTCITFYVMKKGRSTSGYDVPKRIALRYAASSRERLVATDVCEISEEPIGFRMRGGNLVISADNETGTVGLVFRQGNRDVFLTNAHVVTDPGAAPGIITVRLPNGSTIAGAVATMDNLSAAEVRSDAALVAVPLNSVETGMFRGTELKLESCGDIANNDPRRFFYVAAEFVHEVRWRAFVPAPAPIIIDDRPLNYAGFHKFQVVAGQCAPGHSGAVVFCQSGSGLKAVGLLFGGIRAINEVWVFPVRSCLQRMGVDPDSL